MGKSILLFQGSPRKGGNTETLAAAFVKGAEEAGHTVKIVRAADKHIGGCIGCNTCFTNRGVCVQQDDMPEILEDIKAADVYVYATPIYFFNVTAQLKALIDRQYALMPAGVPEGKQAVILLTCGDTNAAVTEPSIMMFRQWFDYVDIEEKGLIVTSNVNNVGDIEGKFELAMAEALGKSI